MILSDIARSRVVVKNDSEAYRPEMLVRVRVVDRESPGALIVPRRAVTESATGWQALISNNGHPVPRPVKLGIATETEVEVKEGLGEGEKVLVPEGQR